MTKQLFGTDGIRGVAGEYPLDDKTVYAIGGALAAVLRDPASNPGRTVRPEVLIGMDTRESSLPLARLLAGGLEDSGAQAACAGVITTAGVAYLTESEGFAAGVMISASHNAFQDNGIKVFGPSGLKLPDDQEHELETRILGHLAQGSARSSESLQADPVMTDKYVHHLIRAGAGAGARGGGPIVVDCANGAASDVAPRLFEALGVEAEFIGRRPDGRNINLGCGSLHLEALQRKVVDSGARLGVALDGDADRALFVTEDGAVFDGDAILLAAADYLARKNRLPNRLVVTTIMANMGLEKALQERGIRMTRTAVGDKYVLEEMLRSGAMLGGEQSGHIIFREYASTGDGLLTAKMILEILADSGEPLSQWRRQLKVFPQQIKNVRVKRKVPFEEAPAVGAAITRSERELGERGRVVVRYSGTEPLVRIMVEAEEPALVEEHVARLAGVMEEQLGS